MATVMLIDDDKERMKYYFMALDEKFTVVRKYGPDDAMEYVSDESNPKPDVIILDIMMSPGTRYVGKSDCEKGLRTGILLYPELKDNCQNSRFLVLTNLKTGTEDFRAIAPNVPVLQKIETPPFDLVERVSELLS